MNRREELMNEARYIQAKKLASLDTIKNQKKIDATKRIISFVKNGRIATASRYLVGPPGGILSIDSMIKERSVRNILHELHPSGAPADLAYVLKNTLHGAKEHHDGTIQKWYADDCACVVTITDLEATWKEIIRIGPKFGFHINPSKCVLLIKNESRLDEISATNLKDITIKSHGVNYLGSFNGSKEYMKIKCEEAILMKCNEHSRLHEITNHEAFASYLLLVKALQHKLTYIK
ncbi:hypothetical protein GJ496_003108 [Pomphorhynchus laevis]|nr:hypothetical protein GJ496_003108 [Pomphorhynchus laevis]